MASCSACKKVKSDISGSTSGFHFFLFFFFFTCLQLIGFDQVPFEGTYYRRELEFSKWLFTDWREIPVRNFSIW